MKRFFLVIFFAGIVFCCYGKSEKKVGFYPDGNKKYSGTLKNEKPEGKWIYWYRNGRIKGQAVYQDGKLHGECLYWNRAGDQCIKGEYREGVPYSGRFVLEWHENGNPAFEIECYQFVLNGKWI